MEYVCTGATLKCTMGTSCPKLNATPKNVSLTGKDQANIADYVSMKNVPSFGRCRSLGYPPTASATAANHGKLTPMPCVPGTCPKWKAIDKDSLICGEPALLKPATLQCMYGGTISIVDPGQTLEIKVCAVSPQTKKENKQKAEQDIPEELLQEFNELDTEGLNKDSVLDGVQLALDAAGMVPVLGAIPDLINASISVLRGDWVGAGLSIVAAVPGVGDVVGGAKIAYKGAKIAKSNQKIVTIARNTKNNQAFGSVVVKQNKTNVLNDSHTNPTTTINTKSVSNTDTITKHKTEVYRIESKKVVGGNPKISIKKETYEIEIRDTSSNTIKNSIDDVGGGVNSNPSGFDKPHTVQSVKSPTGVSNGKQQSSHGRTLHDEHSKTQSAKEPIDINKYRENKNKKEELKPDEKDSLKEIYKYNANQPKVDGVKGNDGLDINS